MSISEAMKHAARGLLHHVDLPNTMCHVDIEVPPPAPINYNFRTNPAAAVANKINLIKFARTEQAAHSKLSVGTEIGSCMTLQEAKAFVETFLATQP